jgi:hypothetical protein
LFGDNTNSKAAGYGLAIDIDFINNFAKAYCPEDLGFQDFPIFAARLEDIRKRMNDWRPQTLRQVGFRPYYDPLTFYAFWFGAIIGMIGLLGLAAGTLQTYASWKTLYTPLAPTGV